MHVVRRIKIYVPLVIVCAIVVDRVLKMLAYAAQDISIRIIPDIFHFSYTLNTRAAFNLDIPPLLYVGLYACAAIFMIWLWLREDGMRTPLLRVSAVLLVIGAYSNIWDRIVYGGVIDMLEMRGVGACNLADIYIVCGVGLWCIHNMRTSK